jgi:hypothetical protein
MTGIDGKMAKKSAGFGGTAMLNWAAGLGPGAAHFLRIPTHHSQIGAGIRRQIYLADDQQIGPGNTGAALARNLVPGGDANTAGAVRFQQSLTFTGGAFGFGFGREETASELARSRRNSQKKQEPGRYQ